MSESDPKTPTKIQPLTNIRKAVLFVDGQDTVASVVEQMIEHEVSSVLVLDQDEEVKGIITERDIVRKFTLLGKEDKLAALANALMTRPVQFAKLKHLHSMMRELHFRHRVRHFPVSDAESDTVHKHNVVGILTTTDLSRAFLRSFAEPHKPKAEAVSAEPEPEQPKILFIAGAVADAMGASMEELLKQLGCGVERLLAPYTALGQSEYTGVPLLFDLDYDYGDQRGALITRAAKHKGHVIFITENPKVALHLRQSLKHAHLHVMMKPIDLSYLQFLFHGPPYQAS